MISYRDRAFCSTVCGNNACPRNFTDEERARAQKWWGKPGAPIAFSPFRDTEECRGFVEVKK